MRSIFSVLLITYKLLLTTASAQDFRIVPLGVRGGADESNLSSYMLAPVKSDNYICLDAGTIHAGIQKAIDRKSFNVSLSTVLRSYIKGYFISHGHLDHLAGMIINSPDDSLKNIYATPATIDVLKNKYFSWQSWANFADEGEVPALKKYHYIPLDSINEIQIAGTEMYVKTFVLSHSAPYTSTAFLVRHKDVYVLYFGDTGADNIEHSTRMIEVWKAVAPLINQKKLKGIFIENSFPDEQPAKQLFGHLTPQLLMEELHTLQSLCTNKNSLKELSVVITHMKPVADAENRIKNQLMANNPIGVKLIFPEQGVAFNL